MATPRFRFPWLLSASLTLNVFLCAVLLAHLRSDWFFRPPPPPPPGHLLEEMTRDLPAEDAQSLRQSLAPSLDEIDKAHRAEETLPQRLQAVLGHEPFDKAAFRNLLAQSQHAREILTEALPAALEKLSPEARRRLAAWRPSGPLGSPGPHMEPPPGTGLPPDRGGPTESSLPPR